MKELLTRTHIVHFAQIVSKMKLSYDMERSIKFKNFFLSSSSSSWMNDWMLSPHERTETKYIQGNGKMDSDRMINFYICYSCKF